MVLSAGTRGIVYRCAALAVLIGAAVGCGHKAPPLAPPSKVPAPTFDLTVLQRGNELVLTMTYPTVTLGGLPIGDLEGIEIWQLTRPVPPPRSADSGTPDGEEAGPGEDDAEAGDPDAIVEAIEDDEADANLEDVTDEPDEEEAAVVARRKEDLVEVDFYEFIATARRRLLLSGAELEAATIGPKLVIRLPFEEVPGSASPPLLDENGEEIPTETAYLLSAKTVPVSGPISGFANMVKIVEREPLPAPASLDVLPLASSIRLTWSLDGDDELDRIDELLLTDEPGEDVEGEAPDLPLDLSAYGLDALERLKYLGSLRGLTGDEVQERLGLAADEEAEEDSEDAEAMVADSTTAEAAFKEFRVYRRNAASRQYEAALRSVPTGRRVFSDTTAVYGERYIYTVVIVAENLPPAIEGLPAGEHETDYQDRFGPLAPRNVIAFGETGRIRVLWDASDSDDVEGYFIHRKVGDGEFAQLNETPLTTLEFSDTDVVSGQTYVYYVVAIDKLDNKGLGSEETEARAP